MSQADQEHDRYDPTGEAAIWNAAAAAVTALKTDMPDDTHGYWNAALDQAAPRA